MVTFHTIITHQGPHFEEDVAVWLLRKFGETKFQGISTAKIEFWSTGGTTPDGRSAEDYEREGILLLGIGGGRFDEHPSANGERKQDECAATLVAKALGVDDDPALDAILQFALHNDLHGGSGYLFDVARIVKVSQQMGLNSSEDSIVWASLGIETVYQEQKQFLVETAKEFEELAKIQSIPGPFGRKLTMVNVVSDNALINPFARSARGANADIVIQGHKSGHVQIFTNRKSRLIIDDVAQMIRWTEQKIKVDRGILKRFETTDWNELAAEGRAKGAEEWFYHIGLRALFNGTLTALKVPPTKIPFDDIKDIVRIAMDPDCFELAHSYDCKQGKCVAIRTNPCLWYNYGLHRCRLIRYQMKTC